MSNTIDQDERCLAPIDFFTTGHRESFLHRREIEAHQEVIEGLEQKLASIISKELGGRVVDVESVYDDMSGIYFNFEVNANWLRKYCEVSDSTILEVENCKLFISVYNTSHCECKGFYGIIERCFIEFVREPILLRAEEQADE